MPAGSCDVLLSDRGPSCYLTEQIAGKKFYHVRFLPNNIAIPTIDRAPRARSFGRDVALDSKISYPTVWRHSVSTLSHSKNVPHRPTIKPADDLSHFPPVPSSAFPKSVSVADLLDARKLIEPPNVTRLKLDLSSIEVSKEDSHFAEGGCRQAFLATSADSRAQEKKWVIKVTKEDHLAPVTENFNMTITQHTRKQVQMDAVARSITRSFNRKLSAAFGLFFMYKKVYFSNIQGKPVTVEEFIPGNFQKHINNTGQIRQAESAEDRILIEKAECLVHYSYVHTKKQMMVLDLQGVDYVLCDPEIATTILEEDGELNFCAGNLSFKAINTFLDGHSCTTYCQMLDLEQDS
eukprot:gene13089-14433_t